MLPQTTMDDFETIWKEAVIACWEYYPIIHPEEWRTVWKNSGWPMTWPGFNSGISRIQNK